MEKVYILLLVCVSIKVGAQTSTFSRADSLLEKGRYELALTQLKTIDTLQDTSNYKIGNIYASVDDFKNAIAYYKKALVFKESFKVQLSLANAYRKEKKYKNAIQIYEKLLEKDSENLIITYQLGKLYFATNDLDKAVQIFTLLSEKDKNNPNYYYQLGLISANKADGNGMLDNFLKAYKSDSTHLKSVYQLARTFSLIRKRDSSRLFTDIGLRLDSLHINLNRLKINELFRDKKYKKAILRLKKLDFITPNNLYNKKMLGRSYFNIDSLDLARTYFKSARNIDKKDFKILTYLGHIYKAEKKYANAIFTYKMATTIGKKPRAEEYYSLALLYLEIKKPKAAIEMFKMSIKENNRQHKVLYQLALTSDSYYKDKKIAYKYYEEYISRFKKTDKDFTAFVKKRMKEIKKGLFLKGEKVE
ncbi:TPR repeat-containing protein YrrB [Polaribacter huanghezhanensis]|uniref:tetratricopeptide repeat protein n=1 Tax=Polaribacter huanghezhanensis TaxID=1354726 RepID=UPI002647DEFE|nr:tetratricopeptide repeat protein [Polaribacter huanghezhanensis]WKD84963.1 TPR repeat-containing protein YrrB [Polaribacter huanghezhanensis]